MQSNFLRLLCWDGNLVRTDFLVTFPTVLLPVMAVKTAVLVVFQQFFFQMETRSGGGWKYMRPLQCLEICCLNFILERFRVQKLSDFFSQTFLWNREHKRGAEGSIELKE